MRNLLFCIAFDGGNYHGWQVQSNAVTVQQTMQDAIEKILGVREDISGCSRTDSGVHAQRYYFHMKTESEIPHSKLQMALNTLLPHDISVLEIKEVPLDFHARYSAVSKEYLYQIWNAAYPNPFLRDRSYHYPYPLKKEKMRKALNLMLGTHDFTSFCSIKSTVEDKTRTILKGEIVSSGSLVQISVQSDGFLYNMVRIIVGTLLFVSEGKIDPEEIPAILQKKDRAFAGKTAPAKGLFLKNVFYNELALSPELLKK